MRKYEFVIIVNPEKEKDQTTLVSKIGELIKKEVSGKVVKKEVWGKKSLAYPIKKKTEGIYVKFDVELDESKIKKFTEALKLEESILRYLLVKL